MTESFRPQGISHRNMQTKHIFPKGQYIFYNFRTQNLNEILSLKIIEISKLIFYRQYKFTIMPTFFQKQIYYQFLTKRVPQGGQHRRNQEHQQMERGGHSNRHFINLLHSHMHHFSTVFFQAVLSSLLELILNTCQIQNVGTMAHTLFLFSLSYRQPGVNVNTEKTLQRSPHNRQNTFIHCNQH